LRIGVGMVPPQAPSADRFRLSNNRNSVFM
jgi:hypothetical protein